MTDSPSSPDVSVVVINWNVPEMLANCLDSIFKTTTRSDLKIEVVVVDSDSDVPGHRDVVQRFPNVALHELATNAGYGAACNAGARCSSGQTILFLNPDTIVHADSIDRLWSAMQLAPHVGLTAPLLLNQDGTIQSMGYAFPGAMNVLCDLFPVPARLYESSLNGRVPPGNGTLPLSIDYALGAALMVRRKAFEQAGGFDEEFFMYSEEVDFQRGLAELDWTRLLVPSARITHLGGQSTGQKPDEMYAALWTSRKQYFGRWATPGQATRIRLAATVGFAIDSIRNRHRASSNKRLMESFRTSQDGQP